MKHPLFQSLSAALLLLALCACTAASPDQTPNPPPGTLEGKGVSFGSPLTNIPPVC